ncbi:restriction endonuclease [Thermococci archaeon]|nr:MAG: restriction endonuclease [Thermococci archaeon]
MVVMMPWTLEMLREIDREYFAELIMDLLRNLEFRDSERIKTPAETGADIIALREDPLSGLEKYMFKIKAGGLVSSNEITAFIQTLDRYKSDRGIFITSGDFTKDAKLLAQREHRGRIILWNGKKVVDLLNEYQIEPKKELIEMIESRREAEKKKKEVLNVVRLESPLLFDFNHEKVIESVVSKLSQEYKIKRIFVSPEYLEVFLSPAYIISWSSKVQRENEAGEVETLELRDKAVIFSEEKIITKASEDEKLKLAVSKALLNDSSLIKCTEKTLEVGISPSKATLLAKSKLSKELGVSQSHIEISDKKKVYVPTKAIIKLKIYRNRGEAEVNLETSEIKINIKPLSEEKLIEYLKDECRNSTKEELREYKTKANENRFILRGETDRFEFGAAIDMYTGAILAKDVRMKRDALLNLIKSVYPRGKIINVEEGKREAVADILVEGKIAVLKVNLENGEHSLLRELHSPDEAFKIAKSIIEENFPIKGMEFESFSITEHRIIEILMSGVEGKARVKVDGTNLDVIDYFVEISPKKAEEIISSKYKEWSIKERTEDADSYTFSIESESQSAKVKLSKDGKFLEELDVVLKGDVARQKAIEHLEKMGVEAKIEEAALKENWEIVFIGDERFGKITLDRKDGSLIEEEINYTERALEKLYYEHLKLKYGEENPITERMTHYRDKGYLTIKVSSGNTLYYAKIDVKTGRVIEEDKLIDRGLMARIKKMQLESKYK